MAPDAAAEEKRRKRLEAWRKRQAANKSGGSSDGTGTNAGGSGTNAAAKRKKPAFSFSMNSSSLSKKKSKPKRAKKEKTLTQNFVSLEEDSHSEDEDMSHRKKEKEKELDWMINQFQSGSSSSTSSSSKQRSTSSSRWDVRDGGSNNTTASTPVSLSLASTTKSTSAAATFVPVPLPAPPASPSTSVVNDALDQFMEQLDSGALGNVVTQHDSSSYSMTINVSGTLQKSKRGAIPTISADDLASMHSNKTKITRAKSVASSSSSNDDGNDHSKPIFTASDWESDANTNNLNDTEASEPETDEDEEAQKSFIEALKNIPNVNAAPSAPPSSSQQLSISKLLLGRGAPPQLELASEVKDEKQRREETVKKLEEEAEAARIAAENTPSIGRLFNDFDTGVMEEAERTLDVLNSEPDALQVLAELNKKKELKAVDHSKVDYMKIRKNLYIVPRSLANLSADDIADRRAKLKVKVRGVGCPAPLSTFREGALSERIMNILQKQKIETPFPVQAQCIPAIMGGRDVIGIAKTGSGKTLAYLLPMLRHILEQPDLEPHESGPIGLILAPARELAAQIQSVCKMFAKQLEIKSTAVYGGAGVAEQIGDLKRGVHVAVATPGRMIDILTMQSGKILSLQRVSYVVMDEADRMFDMGFAPQISAILSAVRPDRQTVLFSATFPKVVENLARKSLSYPIEVIVGGRSVASDSVTQYGEVVEEGEKFLRLLQLLGEHVDQNQKVIVFVDTQVRADSIFQQLISFGYLSLSLHGGKEQEDRDSTISDFKRNDGPNVLVATSVAGRGLDVPSCTCVINFSSPNHLEEYVHRVGRTGRASKKGVSYTFVNSGDEAKFAPIVVRAMIEAGQGENISAELKALSDSFKQKVKKGEARWAGSGFKGKGYTYDSSELNDAQKLARLEKRQALIEAGLIDPEDEEENNNDGDNNNNNGTLNDAGDSGGTSEDKTNSTGSGLHKAVDLSAKLSANVLALPGMQEAILKKVGVVKEDGSESGMGGTNPNHFVEEIEINDYPREARWKVTQKETTSRLQDEFQTAVTLKGEYFGPGRVPNTAEGERKLYLHLEATTSRILKNCVLEIRRLLNEETLRVGTRGLGGSHRYNVL